MRSREPDYQTVTTTYLKVNRPPLQSLDAALNGVHGIGAHFLIGTEEESYVALESQWYVNTSASRLQAVLQLGSVFEQTRGFLGSVNDALVNSTLGSAVLENKTCQ